MEVKGISHNNEFEEVKHSIDKFSVPTGIIQEPKVTSHNGGSGCCEEKIKILTKKGDT